MDDLIDIDLVKGSTFPKTKSKLSLTHVMFNGVVRLVFLPFYLRWWSLQTSRLFATALLVFYLLQVSNLFIFSSNQSSILVFKDKQLITFMETLSPSIIAIILGIMYTYITSALPSNSDIDK
jgi:hypothetical protein